MDRLYRRMDELRPLIETELEKALPRADRRPESLHEAMRYSLLGGGKRMRALLVLLSSEACGGDPLAALPGAVALEMIHAYSLIHDDLPCMDDAEMRRGRLSCHKAFGEALAVLAGDALLTLAFERLSGDLPPAVAAACVTTLSRAAGHVGMVGGQVLDLEGEGQDLDLAAIEAIDRWKTGALISVACSIGGRIAGAEDATLDALISYGRVLGVLYQITDDLLDLEASSEQLGKDAGRDTVLNKATYPAALGIEAAREQAKTCATQAKETLKLFGKEALMLRLLTDLILERKA